MSPKNSPKLSPKLSSKPPTAHPQQHSTLSSSSSPLTAHQVPKFDENLDPATLSFLQLFKDDKIEAGGCIRIFSVPNAKLPAMCGEKAQSFLQVKGQFPSVSLSVDLSLRAAKGYAMVTARGTEDKDVEACAHALETLAKTPQRDVLDLTKGSSYTPKPQEILPGNSANLGSSSFLTAIDMTPALGGENGTAEAAKDVKLPQKFVGMIIGAGGQTIVKLRKHTGAEIALLQDTAAQGYSTAQISGTQQQVDYTVDLLDKMIASGIKAKEGYAQYLKRVQAGEVMAAPFKPEKVEGLEFLEGELDGTEGKGKGFGKSSSKGGWGKGKGFGKGVLRSTGPAGGGPNPALHKHSDSFNVPKKYLGLLIGKQGDSIRKFRAYAAEKNMAIVINQDSEEAHGTVVISGDNAADIVSLKADLTQNLFTAITNLENEGTAGGWGVGSGMGKSVSGGGKGYGPSGSSGQSWRSSGPYGGGGMSDFGNSKGNLNAAGHFVPNGTIDMGGPTGNKSEDASWWADVFTQVLTKKNSPPSNPLLASGGNLGASSFSLDSGSSAAASSSWAGLGLGGGSSAGTDSWDAWGGSSSNGAGGQASGDGDLNNALAALLGNGW